MKIFGERTQLYEKLLEDSDQEDYGSISRTKVPKKYYTVPYSDEEKWVIFLFNKEVVIETIACFSHHFLVNS